MQNVWPWPRPAHLRLHLNKIQVTHMHVTVREALESCSPSWLPHHSVSSPLTLQGHWPSIQSTSSLSTSLYQSSPHEKRSFTINTSSLCAPHPVLMLTEEKPPLSLCLQCWLPRDLISKLILLLSSGKMTAFYFTEKTEIISMVSLTIPPETSTPVWPWSSVHSLLFSFWHSRGKCHPFSWLWIISHPPLQET